MNKQPNSYFCFICGVKNINGVHVNFYEVPAQPPVQAPAAARAANGSEAQADTAAQVAQFPIEILARFTGQEVHQGYPGRMHGGIITGILDETIGRAINIGEGEHPMTWGVTAELTVRFRKPVPLGVELTARGAHHARHSPPVRGRGRAVPARRDDCRLRQGQVRAAQARRHLRDRSGGVGVASVCGLGAVSFTAMTPPTDAQFYAQMTLIRQTEQAFFDLYARGLMAGTVHTSIGQEACAVGVVAALDPERDVIFSSHRAHGHFLAYCDDVEGLVAELLGRRTGVVGGVGGTQHLHTRNLYTNGIQGGIVPNAVGAALAEKLDGSGAIVTVFLGDGTLGEGVVYESMNLASLWQLPVLFVLEDNHYAQSTPKHLEHAGSLADRPRAFGIATHDLTGGPAHTMADALDVTEVYAAACTAVGYVREHGAPYFLALPTYRLAPAFEGRRHAPARRAGRRLEPRPAGAPRTAPGAERTCPARCRRRRARAEGDRRGPGRRRPSRWRNLPRGRDGSPPDLSRKPAHEPARDPGAGPAGRRPRRGYPRPLRRRL